MQPQKDIGIQFLEQKGCRTGVPKLKRLGFTLNYECDGNCTYCFAKADLETKKGSGKEEISLHEFQEILNQAIPLGLEEVQLSGGEPLLKKDIFEFAQTAKDAGLRTGLFTNGSMLDKKTLKKLKSLKLDWIRIGLGGSSYKKSQKAGRKNDTKERFERILKNTKASTEMGFTVGVFTPVTKNNFKDIRATARLAKRLGTKYIIFCNYILLGNKQDARNKMGIREHYKAIEEFLKARKEQNREIDVFAYYGFFEYLSKNWKETEAVLKGPCGRERLAFIANGDVRTCLCTAHKIGSFRKKDFNLKRIWEGNKLLLEIRKNKRVEPCLHCKRKKICLPCLSSTINTTGKIDSPPQECPVVREFFLHKAKMNEKSAIKKALRWNFEE